MCEHPSTPSSITTVAKPVSTNVLWVVICKLHHSLHRESRNPAARRFELYTQRGKLWERHKIELAHDKLEESEDLELQRRREFRQMLDKHGDSMLRFRDEIVCRVPNEDCVHLIQHDRPQPFSLGLDKHGMQYVKRQYIPDRRPATRRNRQCKIFVLVPVAKKIGGRGFERQGKEDVCEDWDATYGLLSS
jgi:hypothetical protein